MASVDSFLNFYDDYSEAVHPEILSYISENNQITQKGYCNDDFCALATERIRSFFGLPNAQVFYFPNGTICNIVGLKAMLRSFESVISADSGHINTHEAGALEAAGHKIVSQPGINGKLTPELADRAYETYEDEHTAVPKALYLTQGTEVGTVYM